MTSWLSYLLIWLRMLKKIGNLVFENVTVLKLSTIVMCRLWPQAEAKGLRTEDSETRTTPMYPTFRLGSTSGFPILGRCPSGTAREPLP